MTDQPHAPLPVAGYSPQSAGRVEIVNEHKEMEERLLRRIESLMPDRNAAPGPDGCDSRWLAIARTHFEEGFMALNRAVFRPQRVKLPGDAPVDDRKPLE